MPPEKAAVGRPREFDEEKALENAMNVFWEKGYERSSVSDLLTAMGINRGSMYAVFGDKEALFDAAIERYRKNLLEPFLSVLDKPGTAINNIADLFDMIAMAQSEASIGCMMCNNLIERANCCEKSLKAAQKFLQTVEEQFQATLQRAKTQGELNKDADIQAIASFLVNNLQGMSVMSKAKLPRQAFDNVSKMIRSFLMSAA